MAAASHPEQPETLNPKPPELLGGVRDTRHIESFLGTHHDIRRALEAMTKGISGFRIS